MEPCIKTCEDAFTQKTFYKRTLGGLRYEPAIENMIVAEIKGFVASCNNKGVFHQAQTVTYDQGNRCTELQPSCLY
jgi:hypothetical protein